MHNIQLFYSIKLLIFCCILVRYTGTQPHDTLVMTQLDIMSTKYNYKLRFPNLLCMHLCSTIYVTQPW